MKKIFRLFWILAFLFTLSNFADTQVSVNVPIEDPVYHDLDKLIGQGLIESVIVGQRPYSRKEIARLIEQALKNLERHKNKNQDSYATRWTYTEEILDRLQKEFKEELVARGTLSGKTPAYSLHLLEKVDFELLTAFSPYEALTPDTLVGGIDAQINPLLQYRQGRHLMNGGNLSIETARWARFGNHFALYAKPRFLIAFSPEDEPNDIHLLAQNAYAKFYLGNFELEVGRDFLQWGQSPHGGLLLSGNARGLDMIKISNDSPVYLPWIFKYLGPSKFTFFFSNLGPEQDHKYAYLLGYKLSFEPVSFFEFGLELMNHSGGEGSPHASFGERVADVFPIIDSFITSKDFQISNKLAGMDFRLRIPPARNLELYGEMVFDDIDLGRLKSMFWEDAGYNLGLYLPRLTEDGRTDLRFEFHHTGLRYYRHSQFLSGVTLNRNLIGDALGPDANGFYVDTTWDVNRNNLIGLHGAFEFRDNDTYLTHGEPDFGFEITTDNPTEGRYRIQTDWTHRFGNYPLSTKIELGYERVQNFNFANGHNRNNFVGALSFHFDLDRRTQFPKRLRE